MTLGSLDKIIEAIVSFIPKEMKGIIGGYFSIFLMALAPLLFLNAFKYMGDSFSHHHIQGVDNWQLQKIDGRLFKLNTATGETIELPNNQPVQKQTGGG